MSKLLGSLILWVFASSALAADPDIFADKNGAVRGVDVVAYYGLEAGAAPVFGTDEFTHEWKGATWKFSSAENRDKFAADPEQYAPQYGGYCAWAVSHNFTKPVSPKSWKVVDGKLYLNINRVAFRKWEKDQSAAIVRADTNWPNVLTQCEKRDNCYK